MYRDMNDNNKVEFIDKKLLVDENFNNIFSECINVDSINKIIFDHLKEDFKIEFVINPSSIDETNKLIKPTIRIKIIDIEDTHNLHNHFNEAKLKLISIAIYFSLAKKYEKNENELKLLILDDFLTSLDMSNRKLIIQYIVEYFASYQKIILTHNIQFYNLIINLLKCRNEVASYWDIKNLFYRKNDGYFESIIYDKETDYLAIAKNYLDNNKLSESGNFLRKEFERIIEELRQINEIGAKEKTGNILSQLINNVTTEDVNIRKTQKILKKAKFYQDSILHSA
jgi:hypothetical protein